MRTRLFQSEISHERGGPPCLQGTARKSSTVQLTGASVCGINCQRTKRGTLITAGSLRALSSCFLCLRQGLTHQAKPGSFRPASEHASPACFEGPVLPSAKPAAQACSADALMIATRSRPAGPPSRRARLAHTSASASLSLVRDAGYTVRIQHSPNFHRKEDFDTTMVPQYDHGTRFSCARCDFSANLKSSSLALKMIPSGLFAAHG